MLRPKKIIHLSDLHIGYQDDDINCLETLKKVKKIIFSTYTPRADYVILITGDIIDNAHIATQWETATNFITEFREETARGDKFDVLLVPGNHDYGTGSNADPKYVEIFKDNFLNEIDFDYPLTKIIGDGKNYAKIAFIGLDSNEDELHWYDHYLADGELGKRQLGKLEDDLRRNDVIDCPHRVVYLHHHPFESPIYKIGHWLNDRRKLKKVLDEAAEDGVTIDALLFGHNHGGKAKHNKWNIPRVYDGGSTGGKRRSSFFRMIPDLSNPNTDNDHEVDVERAFEKISTSQ